LFQRHSLAAVNEQSFRTVQIRGTLSVATLDDWSRWC